MNVVAEIGRINEAELKSGVVGTSASWHAKYANSAWVYAGNLPRELSEGDVICILSQYGEVRVVLGTNRMHCCCCSNHSLTQHLVYVCVCVYLFSLSFSIFL